MKITDIQTYPISFELERPFANSSEYFQKRATTLVKVTTDEGITGWGEAYGPPEGISRVIETYLKQKLIGEDPFKWEFFWNKIQTHKGIPRGAVGGIDIALWDLKARALHVPLYELLGSKCLDEIHPYATGFFFCENDPDSTAHLEKEAERVLENGFRALKMKVGFGKERDMKRMKKVRELIGDSVELMVDANQAYDLVTCLELTPYLNEFNVKWFEEPMPWSNFRGYQELRSKVSYAIAGGEAEITYQGFIEAIKHHIVDVIQPDLLAPGGITICRKIAVLAEAFQIEFQPHVFGTVIALPAAIQLMASLTNNQSWCVFPRSVMLEWDVLPNPMARDILKEPLTLENGVFKVTDIVGLGVEVNEEAIKHYLIT
jgi:D-galactarolactone cycloisomerase